MTLATQYRQTIRTDELLDDVATVAAVDRLQGSVGLYRAADLVAERAERGGLHVELRHYPAGTRWWDFTAPQAPSPIRATLQIIDPDPAQTVTAYPDQPCSLARGSASTPSGAVAAHLAEVDAPAGELPGAFVVSRPLPRFALGPLVERLAAAGVVGVAVESSPGSTGDPDAVNRLEVDDRCPLVVFSVSPAQAGRLRAARRISVLADHGPPATMPLVYARHRGASPVRGLLIGHLCHPAPGANDNASGVAALLGIGRAAGRCYPDGDGPDIGFLWGPEMVGTAAYLHDLAPSYPPHFAVSLDMVATRGGHLIIEPSPDHLPSPIAAALEAAARAMSPDDRSYSGAVTLPTWPRAVTPWVGASDHLLFADLSIAIPAGHVARWPDPTHHTSHDTVDRISLGELKRTSVLAATGVTALCLGGPALNEIAGAMDELHQKRLAAVLTGSGRMDATRYLEQVDRRARTALYRRDSRASRCIGSTNHSAHTGGPARRPVVRRWSGPWNLHNLYQSLNVQRRHELSALLDSGGPGYARLAALAMAIDDHRDLAQLTHAAQLAAGLPIRPQTAAAFLTLHQQAGWATVPAG